MLIRNTRTAEIDLGPVSKCGLGLGMCKTGSRIISHCTPPAARRALGKSKPLGIIPVMTI